MTVIDLNAPTINPTTRVWRVFPGAGYRFLEDFRNSRTAFLDLPGLTLPQGDLSLSDELLPRILASVALNHEISQQRENRPTIPNWQNYIGARRTKHRGRLRQAVVNLLKNAAPGDLIVVPEALNVGYINIGVIENDVVENIPFIRKGWEWQTKGRNIRWISRVRENTVSSRLSSSLRNQHPFSPLPPDLFLEAFSLAFSSYVFGDRKVSSVFNLKDDYLDADSALLGTVAKLAAAACEAIDSGVPGLGVDVLSAILAPISTEYSCSQEADIHSIGFNRFLSSAHTSLVIAALITSLLVLSACNNQAELQVAKQTLTVVNTKDAAGNPCAPPVNDANRRVLNALTLEQTWELCKAAKAAENRAGLTSTARVLDIPIPQARPQRDN